MFGDAKYYPFSRGSTGADPLEFPGVVGGGAPDCDTCPADLVFYPTFAC